MAAPEVFKSTGTADLTTASATYATLATLTCDRSGEAAAKDFLVGGFTGVSTNNSSSLFGTRFTVGGVEIANVGDTTNDQLDVIGSSRYWDMSVIKKISITNASVDIDLDAKTDLGTLSAVGHSMFAVEFGSDWEYAESEAESTTDSVTFQDKTTLTFTPGTTQDYYIVATCEVMMEDETSPAELAIDVDGTDEEKWNPLGMQSSGNDNRYVMKGFHLKKNLDTTSHTIKIQYRATKTGGVDTAMIRNARIVAIPAGGEFVLNDYHVTDDTPETTDTATFNSWTDIETLSPTVNAADHLCFGYMKYNGNVSTEEVCAQVDFDGNDFMGSRLKDSDADNWHSMLGGALITTTAGTKNFKLQGAESAGTETESFDQKHITVLEIGEAVTNDNTHSIDLEAGSAQYLSITDGSQTGLDIASDLTLECWVNLETTGITQIIASKWNSTGNQRSYMFWLDTNDKMNFKVSNDGNEPTATTGVSTTAITAGWKHIAVTYDASAGTCAWYLDGVADGTGSGLETSIYNGTAGFMIGVFEATGTLNFDGKIDDFRVWDDIRTVTEIDDNKALQICGNEDNLQAYWKLNNALTEETSNGNTLTNNGTAVFSTTIPTLTDKVCSVAYSLVLAVGTFTYTGIAALFSRGYTLTSALGTFVLTGIAATLKRGYGIICSVGAYTYTGIAAGLTSTRTLALAVGSYTYTGFASALKYGYGILAALGTYTYTGVDTSFTKALKIVSATGTYAYTGIAAILSLSRRVVANLGSYIYTGIAAILKPSNIWSTKTKNSTSWTEDSKNSTSYTNESKNSTSYTNESKNSTSYTNESKNSTSWTNKSKS